jgi:hypothetical protein
LLFRRLQAVLFLRRRADTYDVYVGDDAHRLYGHCLMLFVLRYALEYAQKLDLQEIHYAVIGSA